MCGSDEGVSPWAQHKGVAPNALLSVCGFTCACYLVRPAPQLGQDASSVPGLLLSLRRRAGVCECVCK